MRYRITLDVDTDPDPDATRHTVDMAVQRAIAEMTEALGPSAWVDLEGIEELGT